MSLALLFHYLMINMFRMLKYPSSGACDLFVELFHGLYCSGSMCVGVTLWFGWGGVVSVWNNSTTKSQAPEIDVLTSETCWALNNEIIKQVTSSWSLFIQRYIIIIFSKTYYVIIRFLSWICWTTQYFVPSPYSLHNCWRISIVSYKTRR